MKTPEKNIILIVFRERNVVDEIVSALGELEFEYLLAGSIKEALSKISFSAPKLVLSETDLGRESGIELCRVLRSSLKTRLIPFIAIAEHDSFDDRIQAIQGGADAYLSRPLNRDELVAHIRTRISQFNEFYQLSTTDELTRLYNRREFFKRFENETARNPGGILSLAILDLDFFKQVNDVYGHQMGDLVLMKLGDILNRSLSKTFFPTRFGGEEFVIMLSGTPAAESKKIIDGIREEFHSLPFVSQNSKTFHVSFTAGISEYPSFGNNLSVLLSRADQALYAAKKDGKGRTYVFDPLMARDDRFWEYLKKSAGYFIEKKGFDAITGLPFLPQVLEVISNLNFEVNSIGILYFSILEHVDIRMNFGFQTWDNIVENLRLTIQKSCESHYATDTYICISDILNQDFIVLFPSIIDFAANRDKCDRLYNEIAADVNERLNPLPLGIKFGSSIIYLNRKEPRRILADIMAVRDITRPLDGRAEKSSRIIQKIRNVMDADRFIFTEYFSRKYFYSLEDGSRLFSYPTFDTFSGSYAGFEAVFRTIIRSRRNLISFLEQFGIIAGYDDVPVMIPWIESIELGEYCSIITSIFGQRKVFLTINEHYLVHEHPAALSAALENLPQNIRPGLSNCYISSEILNVLSMNDFGVICLSEHLIVNMQYLKERIKILNGFKVFVDQLGIPTCADNVLSDEELQLVRDLSIHSGSGQSVETYISRTFGIQP